MWNAIFPNVCRRLGGQMQPRSWRLLLPLLVLAGCGWGVKLDRLIQLNEQLAAAQAERSAQQTARLDQLVSKTNDLEKSSNLLTSLALCPNPVVREFVQRCKGAGECSIDSLELALGEMTRFKHVMVPYSTSRLPQEMVPLRNHEVNMLASGLTNRLSTTRLLVIALPFSTKSADQTEAERLAGKFRDYFRGTVYAATHPNEPPLPSLEPTTIGCTKRQQLIRKYHAMKKNQRYPGEPADTERHTVIFAFLVDC